MHSVEINSNFVVKEIRDLIRDVLNLKACVPLNVMDVHGTMPNKNGPSAKRGTRL